MYEVINNVRWFLPFMKNFGSGFQKNKNGFGSISRLVLQKNGTLNLILVRFLKKMCQISNFGSLV